MNTSALIQSAAEKAASPEGSRLIDSIIDDLKVWRGWTGQQQTDFDSDIARLADLLAMSDYNARQVIFQVAKRRGVVV